MKIKDKSNLIFLHKTIKSLADSMIKIFIPLLILQASNSMTLVIIYLCSYYPLCSILNLVLRKFLHKFGLIAIIIHSIPIIATQFLLNLTMTWWLCIILALLMAFAQVFYYVPINTLFSLTDKKVNVAKFEISSNIGKIIFTLLSGYVLGSEIENSLLIVSLVCSSLYIISSIPLLYGYRILKDSYKEVKTTPVKIDKKEFRWFNLYHIQFGLYQSILDVALPLFLFIENLTFQSLTIVIVLIEFFKICSNALASYLTKKNLGLLSIIISLAITLASFMIIIFIRNSLALYICSCCLGIGFPMLFVPLFAIFVKKVSYLGCQFQQMSYRDVYIFSFRAVVFVPYLAFPNFLLQFVAGTILSVTLGLTSGKIFKNKKDETVPTKDQLLDTSCQDAIN